LAGNRNSTWANYLTLKIALTTRPIWAFQNIERSPRWASQET
jgi:hypothetical protein